MDLKAVYTQMILEESRNSMNRRELPHHTHKEPGHNPSCGDEIELQADIKGGVISDASYTGQGCAISQASTSIMCDVIKNMKEEDALKLCDIFIRMVTGEKISADEEKMLEDAAIFKTVQNMPARTKCAVLPWYTLKHMLSEK